MSNKKQSKKHRKSNRKKVTLIVLLFAFLVMVGFGGTYAYSMLSNVHTKEINKDNESLGIDETKLFPDDVLNIALLGVDQREKDERGRSDSIMIVSIDKKHKKIKLSSLMRDSYVNIEGHGKTKLNHAYAYGGPQLSLKTINQTFGLNVKDYASVNFLDLAHIIDELGGVPVNVKSGEVKLVNEYIDDVSHVTGLPAEHLTKSGEQNLSGVQAVAYSRIRYVGNGDYERTQRQRTVLTGILNKINTIGITEYPGLVRKLLPYVETSLSTSDIIGIGTSVLTSGINTIETARFPTEDSSGKIINKVWYLPFNKEKAQKELHAYIYDDIVPKEDNN